MTEYCESIALGSIYVDREFETISPGVEGFLTLPEYLEQLAMMLASWSVIAHNIPYPLQWMQFPVDKFMIKVVSSKLLGRYVGTLFINRQLHPLERVVMQAMEIHTSQRR